MKMGKKILGCVVLLTMFVAGSAFAVDLNGATVESVGVDSAANVIMVTHPDLTGPLTAQLSGDLGDAGLATALSAVSLGKTVSLTVDSVDVTQVATATAIYVNK